MVNGERHIDAGRPERPEFAVEGALARDLLALHRQNDVAGLELGARRRAVGGDADHHDLIVNLGRVHSEPGARRLVDAAEFTQIVEHRLEQVDRHDHVDVLGLALALAFELQRADADQLARGRDQRGAAPIGMRGVGEDRLFQQVFPIAGEFLPGGDLARHRARAPAGAADHDVVADFGRGRRADRQPIEIDAAERLHQAEAGDGIEAQRMAFDHAAVAEMQPDRLGFGDQIADRQHQSVIDHHAIAGALGPERLRGKGVGRDDGVQAYDGGKRAIEIETVIARAGLIRGRHSPFGQRGHGYLRPWGALENVE